MFDLALRFGWLSAVSGLPKTGEPEVTHWNTMGVAMLKAELRKRGLMLTGKKADLIARLEAAAAAHEAPVKAEASNKPEAPSSQPAPGTAGLGPIATAQVTHISYAATFWESCMAASSSPSHLYIIPLPSVAMGCL